MSDLTTVKNIESFIGNDANLEVLEDCLDKAEENSCQCKKEERN